MSESKKIAAALKYDYEKDDAPVILAKGKGEIAERILDEADNWKIPTFKDEELAKQLMNLSVGVQIPPDLYKVVAEVLAFVINLDESRTKSNE